MYCFKIGKWKSHLTDDFPSMLLTLRTSYPMPAQAYGDVLKHTVLAGRGGQLQCQCRFICLTWISLPRTLRACPGWNWLARCVTTLLCGSFLEKGELDNRCEMWQPLLLFIEKTVSATGAGAYTAWFLLFAQDDRHLVVLPQHLVTRLVWHTSCSWDVSHFPGGSKCRRGRNTRDKSFKSTLVSYVLHSGSFRKRKWRA